MLRNGPTEWSFAGRPSRQPIPGERRTATAACEVFMLIPTFARLAMSAAGTVLAALVFPLLAAAELCVEGPLPGPTPLDPGNPNNRLRLCSPGASELRVRVTPIGVLLSWNAPSLEDRAYTGPLTWTLPDSSLQAPAGVLQEGAYRGITDRVIELAVVQIADTLQSGTVGAHRIRLLWSSVHESTGDGRFNGQFILGRDATGGENVGVPVRLTTASGDTSVAAGVRLRFERGTVLHKEAVVRFELQSFDGYHVWRWTSNPRLEPKAWGTYSRVSNAEHPPPRHCQRSGDCWPDASPQANEYTFIDENVFDALTYHYAVTAFDEGFDPKTGRSLGLYFDSPLPPADATGLGETQVRVEYRLQPPAEFRAVVAFPNPFRQTECDRLFDPDGTCNVHFKNLPPRSQLLIYTLAGDLVQTIDHASSTVGTISWDTKNGQGLEVASGVYIYKIVDFTAGGESFGRLTIIR